MCPRQGVQFSGFFEEVILFRSVILICFWGDMCWNHDTG